MTDLRDLSLRQLGALLREGRLSARELTDAALSNMALGAYREVDADLARRQAAAADAAFVVGTDLGPLQGVPVSIKDLYGVPGYATFAGSTRRLPARFEQPGPVVRTVLDQLGVVTGKTHTVEFAFGGVGTNPHYPTPINPWDAATHRAPGGSSAGAGVSLCEGSALLALGTDTAGSVRIPASWTGNTAIKLAWGRWSLDGIVPLSPTLDTAGMLARTIDDLVLAFRTLDPTSEPIPRTPEPSSLRLGRCDQLLFDDCSPGVVEAVDQALAELSGAGAQLRSIELPELEPTWQLFRQGGPVSVELYHFLLTQLPEWLDTLDPNVRGRVGDASALPAHEYLERLRALRRRAAAVASRLRGLDALVCPTVANTPPRLQDIDTAERYGPQNLLSLRNTAMVSYLGLCAVTLPVGLDAAQMPVGLQLIGRAGTEPRLLALARRCERLLGNSGARLGLPPRLPSVPPHSLR